MLLNSMITMILQSKPSSFFMSTKFKAQLPTEQPRYKPFGPVI